MGIPATGDELAGRFRILGPALGAGATGVVLPARDAKTGREIVVKVLHDHLVADPEALGRLEVQAEATRRLAHPHVLPVWGIWQDGDRSFLVADRFAGRSLEEQGAPMSTASALRLATQLADALVAAHEAGLVHGDVRPGNVLWGEDGVALFDFGVGAWAGLQRAAPASRPGETAPEVLAGGEASAAADLYGLGVTLFFALTGRRPFEGPTPWAVLGAQRLGPPSVDAPRGVAQLLRALLDPDLAVRPASARQVRRALVGLARAPEGNARLGADWAGPRPGRAWIVHGPDPLTGGPALVARDLSRGRAHDLAEHLQREGWEVRATRVGLTAGDLALIAALGVGGAAVLPVVGALPATMAAVWWRSQGASPRLLHALPPVRTAVPPQVRAPGAGVAIAAGLLMLVTAGLLWGESWVAVVPIALLLGVVVQWLTRVTPDPEQRASSARIAALLEDTRRLLEQRVTNLDEHLSVLGEIEALEDEWSRSELGRDEVVLRAEALLERVSEARRPASSAAGVDRRREHVTDSAVDAIRCSRDGVGRPDTSLS